MLSMADIMEKGPARLNKAKFILLRVEFTKT